jgi:hypothetical protein
MAGRSAAHDALLLPCQLPYEICKQVHQRAEPTSAVIEHYALFTAVWGRSTTHDAVLLPCQLP